MSEQPIDARRFLRIVRRHKAAVIIFAVLGVLAGAGYTILRPPMFTSKALVVVSSPAQTSSGGTDIMPTQVVVASSNPVLTHALPHIHSAISLQTLRNRVQVANVTGSSVLSISAQGVTAGQAKETANSVTKSYVAYTKSSDAPGGPLHAQVLELGANGIGPSLPLRLLETGAIGGLLGVLIGAVLAFALGRSDRRLRTRDDIADSIGVPVLASISVERPGDAAGWMNLLSTYEPSASDAWRLQKTLRSLPRAVPERDSGISCTILSLSADTKAIALGPQLAAFAASMGIPTALVVGPLQNGHGIATLRAACAAPSGRSKKSRRWRNLMVMAADGGSTELPRGAALTIVVTLVEEDTPRVADWVPTDLTLLGVSTAAVTAEQLARVAARTAADGRELGGILVADPDPADRTTGRFPELSRPGQWGALTRVNGAGAKTIS